MSLADLHHQRPRRRSGGTCTITRIIARLDDDDDRAWLLDALANPDETSADIARTLTEAGHSISPVSLARHRRKDCTCESR